MRKKFGIVEATYTDDSKMQGFALLEYECTKPCDPLLRPVHEHWKTLTLRPGIATTIKFLTEYEIKEEDYIPTELRIIDVIGSYA